MLTSQVKGDTTQRWLFSVDRSNYAVILSSESAKKSQLFITSLMLCTHNWQGKEQANKYAQRVCNYQLSFIIIRPVEPVK